MRVFLDTNVLVAAFTTRGLCADVVRYVLAEHQLVSGDVILDELHDVLANRFKLPASTTKDILDLIRGQEVVAKPKKAGPVAIRDPDDGWVLASAIEGRCDVLVTGDRDLLDIAEAAPLPILSPRGFWEFVRR
ncbi:MAG: putative toxin-antitoxin system toxin component, PIN family [Acidobacteria bacterium]|nr:putative toxin-antitoxin system toxin component, PIN family [Acidobacteriota bacterium]